MRWQFELIFHIRWVCIKAAIYAFTAIHCNSLQFRFSYSKMHSTLLQPKQKVIRTIKYTFLAYVGSLQFTATLFYGAQNAFLATAPKTKSHQDHQIHVSSYYGVIAIQCNSLFRVPKCISKHCTLNKKSSGPSNARS